MTLQALWVAVGILLGLLAASLARRAARVPIERNPAELIGTLSWHRAGRVVLTLGLGGLVVSGTGPSPPPATAIPYCLGALGVLLREKRTRSVGGLHERLQGNIYVHEVTQLEIASTDIRSLVADGYDPRYLMPDSVRGVILESSCYTSAGQ